MAGKVFLGVSVKVLPEEIDICVGGLGEEDPEYHPISCQCAQNKAGGRRWGSTLPADFYGCLLSPVLDASFHSSCPGHWTSGSFGLWTLWLVLVAYHGTLGFGHRLKAAVSFPGFEAFEPGQSRYQLLSSPACRQPIVELHLIIVEVHSS